MAFPQQSPINIRRPIPVVLGARGLDVRYAGASTGVVVKETLGAKVQFARDYSQQIVVDLATYGLDAFHFHRPSEHAIEGKFADIELHLVHSHVDDGIRYAVIAVLIRFDDRAAEPAEELKAFFHRLAAILAATEDPGALDVADREVTLEPAILLPPGRPEAQAYYRYEGSLTTPDHDESVSWVVLPPVAMKRAFFEDLHLLEHMEKPARAPQPLGRRFVLVNLAGRPTGAAKAVGDVAAKKGRAKR